MTFRLGLGLGLVRVRVSQAQICIKVSRSMPFIQFGMQALGLGRQCIIDNRQCMILADSMSSTEPVLIFMKTPTGYV